MQIHKFSEEYMSRQLVRQHADVLVRLTYAGLLEREPDPDGFIHWKSRLEETGDFPSIISGIAASQERQDVLSRILSREQVPSDDKYDIPALIFLHAQKTAGTTLQNILVQVYGDAAVYHEHADTLYFRSPYQLAPYTVFAGHFNYDSIRYIPRSRRNLITIVREPKARLVSLYNFWRAHEPGHPSFARCTELANRLDIVEFLEHPEIHEATGTWNHMTWVVMGDRIWKEWKDRFAELAAKPNEIERTRLIMEASKAIWKRLSEFLWVGIQEEFDASIRLLCDHLGLPYFEELPVDHSLTKLMATDPHFKRSMTRQTISDVSPRMYELMELDAILYKYAKTLLSGSMRNQHVQCPS